MDDDLETDPLLVGQLEKLMADELRDPLLAQVPKQFDLPADLSHSN
jgi:hypothetical protein